MGGTANSRHCSVMSAPEPAMTIKKEAKYIWLLLDIINCVLAHVFCIRHTIYHMHLDSRRNYFRLKQFKIIQRRFMFINLSLK